MTKEQVINVEEYPMQDENGNSIFVVGGYKFTTPKGANALLDKYRKNDEDFRELERLLRKFINSQPYTGGLSTILLLSEIISDVFRGVSGFIVQSPEQNEEMFKALKDRGLIK